MRYIEAFVYLWLWRYTRLIVHIIASWTFRPIRPAVTPTFTNNDVTVVLPTLGTNEDFCRCIMSINACSPKAIIVVTPEKNVARIKNTCNDLGLFDVTVLGAQKANKRLQMIQGLKNSATDITVFADDDVFWRPTFLTYILAPFEDPKVGGAGGFTGPSRPRNPNVWEFLGACYLERWNFEIAATSHMDGGISCLSGRTSVVRTKIVQDPGFLDEFANEKFIGCIPLVAADDDNCITRWMVNHGWKIRIQCAKEAELTTTLEDDSSFLGQCVRWSRTTWRSNFTSMFLDRKIWRAQPWSSYALHLSSLNPPALVNDGLLVYLLYQSVKSTPADALIVTPPTAFVIFFLWLLFTKVVKLLPYFYRYPSDIKLLPVSILFGYFHGFLKAYTLLTVNKTSWNGGHSLITTATLSMSKDSVLRDTGSNLRETGSNVLHRMPSFKRLKSAAGLDNSAMQTLVE